MQVRRSLVTLFAAAMLPGAAALAQQSRPAPAAPGGEGRSMDHGTMGGGMMGGGMMGRDGMMDMMQGCQRMMVGAASGATSMPKMPSGNEKLEFQMHAEMMQKMGEVAAKYAERIREAK